MDTRDRSLPRAILNTALEGYAVQLRRVAAHRATMRVKQVTKFLDVQPFEAIVNGKTCGYFSNADCAARTARYRAEQARLESKWRNEGGQFCAGAEDDEVCWCVFDHRTGKVLTGEELRAAAQAVNL